MYLSECPSQTKFKITELWFFYSDREDYQYFGINEGEEIFVLENDHEHILVCKNVIINDEPISLNIDFTYELAAQIYGEVVLDKQKESQKCYLKQITPYYSS